MPSSDVGCSLPPVAVTKRFERHIAGATFAVPSSSTSSTIIVDHARPTSSSSSAASEPCTSQHGGERGISGSGRISGCPCGADGDGLAAKKACVPGVAPCASIRHGCGGRWIECHAEGGATAWGSSTSLPVLREVRGPAGVAACVEHAVVTQLNFCAEVYKAPSIESSIFSIGTWLGHCEPWREPSAYRMMSILSVDELAEVGMNVEGYRSIGMMSTMRPCCHSPFRGSRTRTLSSIFGSHSFVSGAAAVDVVVGMSSSSIRSRFALSMIPKTTFVVAGIACCPPTSEKIVSLFWGVL